MAHANELFPFATGDGANVESASLWEGDNARQIGFVAGIASSQKVNTALRQAAFTSAMIGQFTAGYGPADVVDDGNVTTYENNFVAALGAALQSLIPAGLLYEGIDTGTQNAVIVTATVPALSVFPVGSFIAVRKMVTTNSGAMTATVLDKTGPLAWPDASPLSSGQFPGSAECLLFYDGSKFQLMTFPGPSVIIGVGSGEGIDVTNNTVSLAFHGLLGEGTLADTDEFAFWQTVNEGGLPLNHHRKITVAQLKSVFAPQSGGGANAFYFGFGVAATQTVTVPSWAKRMHARVWAAGGAGGAGNNGGSGGGGGGGEYREFRGLAPTPGSTLTCIVGAGGAKSNAAGGSGGNGGSSSVIGGGFSMICIGGTGGQGTATPYVYQPGAAGGTGGSGGDMAVPGSLGGHGSSYWTAAGGGGLGTPANFGQTVTIENGFQIAGVNGNVPAGGGGSSAAAPGYYPVAGDGAAGRVDIWFFD